MRQVNDYGQWESEFYSDLVYDYNKKYGTDFVFPEDEDPDLDRWLSFLEVEYDAYVEAWQERIELMEER